MFVIYRVCYVYCWSVQGLFVYGWLWQPYTLHKIDSSKHIDELHVLNITKPLPTSRVIHTTYTLKTIKQTHTDKYTHTHV